MDRADADLIKAALGRISALETQIQALAQLLVAHGSLKPNELQAMLAKVSLGDPATASGFAHSMDKMWQAVQTAAQARKDGRVNELSKEDYPGKELPPLVPPTDNWFR